MCDQRIVVRISSTDLRGIGTQFNHDVDTFHVEDGGPKLETALAGMLLELLETISIQLQSLQQLVERFVLSGCGLDVSGAGAYPRHQAIRVELLEFDPIRTTTSSHVDQRVANLHVPVVITACLGDDEDRLVVTNRVVSDFQRDHLG